MPRQILIWSCCLLLVQLASALTGDNVCKRIETSTEKIDYVVTEPVTYRLYTWCLKVPPRCSKYTTVMKERIKTKLQINNHTIDFCCDGFVQLETYCVPECNRSECPHLICDSEKKCTCEAGFHGQRCHRECRPGFWGENCNNKCVCNGQPCNIKSGDCDQTTSTTQSTTISDSHFLIPNNANTENNKFNKEISPNIPSSKNPLHNNYNTKKEKTESSQDIIQLQQELLNQEATVIPSGISLEDMQTTLLPEDEVMIVYPSMKSKPTTELINPTLKKTTTTITKLIPTFITTKKPILKYIPTESTSVLKPNYNTEKYNNKKLSTIDYISIKHELNMNKNNKYNSNILSTTTESGKLTDENEKNKQHINRMNTVPKKNTNGLPPPVPDGSDNTINLKSNGKKNLTLFDNYENNNNNGIIKSNEIQRDMEEIINNNNNNYSRSTNTDTTVNSSLVKAKWNSAFDAIDFSSLSIGISITVLTIIFLMLIVVMSTCLKKNKNDNTTSYYDNNTKTCHDNGIPCNGHYASPSGQPIFFCPAFTNSYAFELAQELRDTHYDHPRSVRCLSSEPVYAELQY